jgi:hypothetical protein
MPSGSPRPSRLPPASALAPIVAAGLLLAACSRSPPAPQLVCPRPGIVNGVEQTAAYRPGGSGDADLRWVAVMQNIDGGCRYDDGLEVDLSVDLVVEPGPAYEGGPIDLRYFVAVAGPSGEILDKQIFTTSVTPVRGATRGGSRESFTQRYPGATPAQGGGYRIYLGFDVPVEEALRRRSQFH